MSEKRTEEEIVTRTGGISVKLGGREYTLTPPVIKQAREWRSKLAEVAPDIGKLFVASVGDPDFDSTMGMYMTTLNDKVAELVRLYAPDLPWEEIEASATEQELAAVFGEVLKQAFPLADSLVTGVIKVQVMTPAAPGTGAAPPSQ